MSASAIPVGDVVAGEALLRSHSFAEPNSGKAWIREYSLAANSCFGCTASVVISPLDPFRTGGTEPSIVGLSTGSARTDRGLAAVGLSEGVEAFVERVPPPSLSAARDLPFGPACDVFNRSMQLDGRPLAATPASPTILKSPFETCLEILQARRGLLAEKQLTSLQRQVSFLLLPEGAPSVSTGSLNGLIDFIGRHKPVAHPNLSLTRNGKFAASWSSGPRAKVTLTFDRDGGDWVGMDLTKAPAVRASGAFVIDSLAGLTQPFKSWVQT